MPETSPEELAYLETPAQTPAAPESAKPARSTLIIRVPRLMHSELQALAAETGVSMNELSVGAIEAFLHRARKLGAEGVLSETVKRRKSRREGE